MRNFLWVCVVLFICLSAGCASPAPQKEMVFKNTDKEEAKASVTKNLLLKPDTILSKSVDDELWFDRHFMDSSQGQRLVWTFIQSGKDVRVSIRCFMVLEFGENEKVFEESNRDNCDEYRQRIGFK